jgi:hypothetical protein
MLCIVLVAGSPIFGVVFAASVVGMRFEGLHLRPKFNRLTRQELAAMRLTEGKAVRRHKAGAQRSQGDGPLPACSGGTWRAVLGLPLNEHRRSVAHRAYRTLARVYHPDLNGSNAAMQIVNDAWKQAKKELVLQ